MKIAALVLLCVLLLPSAPDAQAVEATITYPKIRIADRVLVDHKGEAVRFRGQVIGARPAIISFTFTGCSSVCPVSDLVMNAVEFSLQGRSQRPIPHLFTLTIDPLTDTKERLAAHAAEIGSGEARVWLTGDYRDVYDVLDGLGMQFGTVTEHQAFFLIVGGHGKRIARVPLETATPESLLRLIADLE